MPDKAEIKDDGDQIEPGGNSKASGHDVSPEMARTMKKILRQISGWKKSRSEMRKGPKGHPSDY